MDTRQLFLRFLAQTSEAPLQLEIDRAEGCYLFDPSGKHYLDLISGIGLSPLGHRHPAVVRAVEEQIGKYWHTMVYGEYILSPQVALARKLSELLPDPLDNVFLVNSGSEAVEGAMKLAKRYTGRPDVLACRRAYHGSTQGAASLMDPTTYTRAYHPLLPGIGHIDFNENGGLEKIGGQTAAVIVETVQGEAGVQKPDPEWLRQLRETCSREGALLIFDEIQAGMGRTGHLWAFEAYGVVPDVLLLAKGLGGGMPIGAFIAPQQIMSCLTHDPVLGHITTFGGHPVSCAAALATLNELTAADLIGQVSQKESLFRSELDHPSVREVRSAGLLMAVEIGNFEEVLRVVRACIRRGLITDWFLFNDRSIRIAPPLIIEPEQIRKACSILLEAINEG